MQLSSEKIHHKNLATFPTFLKHRFLDALGSRHHACCLATVTLRQENIKVSKLAAAGSKVSCLNCLPVVSYQENVPVSCEVGRGRHSSPLHMGGKDSLFSVASVPILNLASVSVAC